MELLGEGAGQLPGLESEVLRSRQPLTVAPVKWLEFLLADVTMVLSIGMLPGRSSLRSTQ